MARCLISFGANLGDAHSMVLSACKMLESLLPKGDQLDLSRLYQTPSIGGPSGQPPFVNAVAAIETRLNPLEMWQLIRAVEQHLGRQRIRRWEARKIDLDILLYEDVRIWTAQLKIPHPRMCMRRFILLPALDVAPDWMDPVSQWTIAQLAAQVSRGKGTLILVADQGDRTASILGELCRASHARQIPASQFSPHIPINDDQRAVCWMAPEVLFANRNKEASQKNTITGQMPIIKASPEPCPAKLLFFLKSVDNSTAWEDQHRELAFRLGLCEPSSGPTEHSGVASPTKTSGTLALTTDFLPTHNCWQGPRYLLATNDASWAVHELVAALDALDCPVESLPR